MLGGDLGGGLLETSNRRGCVMLGGFRPRIGEGVLCWVVLDLE